MDSPANPGDACVNPGDDVYRTKIRKSHIKVEFTRLCYQFSELCDDPKIVNPAQIQSNQKQLCETAEELMNVLEKLQDDTSIGVVEADLEHAMAASERFWRQRTVPVI